MKAVAKFEKVSFEQFKKDWDLDGDAVSVYEQIKLPARATTGSAGYDFFAPCEIKLAPGETVKIPTGIRAKIDDGYVLSLYPRSGLGFKFRLQLNNTVGIIDSDYYNSDNEGHIFIKITNDGKNDKTLKIKKGEAFAQGIFFPYFLTDDDNVTEIRTGGIGSTNK